MNAKVRYYKYSGVNVWDGKPRVIVEGELGQVIFYWDGYRWNMISSPDCLMAWGITLIDHRTKPKPRQRIYPLELVVLGIPRLSIEEIVKDFGKSIGQKLKIVGK